MTGSPPPTAPQPEASTGRLTASGKWLKIALALSVAVNLCVAGLVAGALLKDGRDRGFPRDLNFGPFSEALSPEDRREMRRELLRRAPELRGARAEAKVEFQALVSALRATPFDPAALTQSLVAIETRMTDRLALGRSLIEGRLQDMTDTERQAFADRLESGLQRMP